MRLKTVGLTDFRLDHIVKELSHHYTIKKRCNMKKTQSKVGFIFFVIILSPVLLPIGIFLLLSTPFELINYRHSHFYKDFQVKYRALATSSIHYRLYNKIKEAPLPIEYLRDPQGKYFDDGYFFYRDVLFVNDLFPHFDNEKKTWMVKNETEHVKLRDELAKMVLQFNKLRGENVCRRAVALVENIFEEDLSSVDIESDDVLLYKDKGDIAALKQFIEIY